MYSISAALTWYDLNLNCKKTCHQLATCLCWQTGYSLQVVCQGFAKAHEHELSLPPLYSTQNLTAVLLKKSDSRYCVLGTTKDIGLWQFWKWIKAHNSLTVFYIKARGTGPTEVPFYASRNMSCSTRWLRLVVKQDL